MADGMKIEWQDNLTCTSSIATVGGYVLVATVRYGEHIARYFLYNRESSEPIEANTISVYDSGWREGVDCLEVGKEHAEAALIMRGWLTE